MKLQLTSIFKFIGLLTIVIIISMAPEVFGDDVNAFAKDTIRIGEQKEK